MVVTESEFLLVDPDKNKIGWGVVHFIAFLQVVTELNVHVYDVSFMCTFCLSGCGCDY